MHLDNVTWMMFVLSALSGAVHVLAPDHWLPTSAVSWQRGWSFKRSLAVTLAALSMHVALGFFLFLGFLSLRGTWLPEDETALLGAAFAVVCLMLLIRMSRLRRLRDVLLAGPKSPWAIVAIFSLLGPCEYLLPILLKSNQLGLGYLVPCVGFGVGSLVASAMLVNLGQKLWNRPFWLPRSLFWGQKPKAMIPVLTCLVVGLGAILRLG
jgi:hypothetical protein